MKGQFLVLEGGDGAGKSSQLTLLADFFRKCGQKTRSIHFPRLQAKPYGDMIAAFLRGEYGGDVHPRLAALLYALDRQQAATDLRKALESGETILADRYIFSNLAYQGAKTEDAEERHKLFDWIEKLEYGHNAIPRPDLTLYLDVPLDFSLAALGRERTGQDRAYLRGGKDIHESDATLQQRVREQFLALAKARTGEIGVVDCRAAGGGMADKATIHSRIVDALRYYGLVAR